MIDVERAVLGCLIEDSTLLATAESLRVTEDSFSVPQNGVIYNALRHLIAEEHPTDPVTLHSHLTSVGDIESAGGAYYVSALTDELPHTGSFDYYVDTLKDAEIKRNILTGLGAVSAAHDVSGRDLLAFAESLIGKIGEENYHSGFVRAKDIVDGLVVKMEEGETNAFGIPTGFDALDRMTLGFHDGNLVTIAARPGLGKSALAKDMAKAAALNGKHVAIFSIEMDKDEVGFRLLSDFTELPTEFLKGGKFGEVGWKNVFEARKKIESLSLHIEDKASITIPELISSTRRLKQKNGLDLLIVDYLQLMDSGFGKDSRNEEVGAITRSLKRLAKSLDIPVIALSQLNRKVEERIDQRPILSDLRESGSIEQDSDIVIFIHQNLTQKDSAAPRDAEIIVAKNRNGRVGSIWLTFQPTLTRFINRRKKNGSSDGTTSA